LSIFVAHIYGVGTIGILFLGIGMHAFLPLTVCIACLCLLRFSLRNGKMQYHAVLVGVVSTLAYVTSFVIEWNTRVTRIETLANQSVMYPEMELPVWVTIGQSLKNDWISQRILKSDLVYTTHNRFTDWRFMPSSPSWSEVKKHDPLVYIASFFAGISVSKDDQVKILQSFHNGRHQAQERLWSGDNLTTSYIVSDVDIYTDLRLAYTEKYLNIRNNAGGDGWGGNTEEAIYTFQLPEGSVVTSLSLWINGTEQKGILTSKQKAVKALRRVIHRLYIGRRATLFRFAFFHVRKTKSASSR
jgi:XrtN system VIT domain protein